MASVSVAFSAINPIQINNRLIALNIKVSFLYLLLLLSLLLLLLILLLRLILLFNLLPLLRRRLFFFEQNLVLQNEIQLRIELLFIRGADDSGPQLLNRREHFRVHVEGNE